MGYEDRGVAPHNAEPAVVRSTYPGDWADREATTPQRAVAWDRPEGDPCQAGTPGCAIDHAADRGGCETW